MTSVIKQDVKTANIAGLATIIIWSLTSAVLALIGDMPPFLLGAFCFLLSFAITASWWVFRGENILHKFKMPLSSYALGVYGIFVYNAIYIYAFKTGPALEVNLLNYTWPAFLIVFGCLLQKTMPDRCAVAGILLCLAGSFFVFKSRGFHSFSGNYEVLMLGLLCSFMWASYSALSKYISTNVDQVGVFFLIAGLMFLLLHFLFEDTLWPASRLGWLMLILYAPTRLTFFMWDYAMKYSHGRVIASLSSFIPLFSTLGLVALGFLTYSPALIAGAVLIISGCIVINWQSLMHSFLLRKERMA